MKHHLPNTDFTKTSFMEDALTLIAVIFFTLLAATHIIISNAIDKFTNFRLIALHVLVIGLIMNIPEPTILHHLLLGSAILACSVLVVYSFLKEYYSMGPKYTKICYKLYN